MLFRSAGRNFGAGMSGGVGYVLDETGDAPMFALIFVSPARPMHIGSS